MIASRKRKHNVKPANARTLFVCSRYSCMISLPAFDNPYLPHPPVRVLQRRGLYGTRREYPA
jgi:hypothetical protein